MHLLLALFLFQAGPSQPVGVVTGLVRGADTKPAVGMRVFAIALRDVTIEAAKGPTVFESIAQTDASGRYSLEVPPGRYFIACGSVATPTYYPGTTDMALARPITIAAGGQVSEIDIAGFIAPPVTSVGNIASFRTLSFVPPTFATTVTGTIRLQDGTPAKGMEVIGIPVPTRANAEVSARSISGQSVFRSRSDDLGHYQFVNVPPGSYYVMSGTKDVPTFYPGVPDLSKATPIVVSLPQSSDKKDFPVAGVSLSGRVTASGGFAAVGTRIRVRLLTLRSDASGPRSFMPSVLLWETFVDDANGSYSVGGLPPGSYIVEAEVSGLPPQTMSVTVGDQAAKSVDFALPVATVSGKIVFEAGSSAPLPDARAVGSVVLSTEKDAGLSVSTVLRVFANGTFGNVLEAGEYRVSLPTLPGFLIIKSMTAGAQDLLKEKLKVTDATSVSVEIRLGRK